MNGTHQVLTYADDVNLIGDISQQYNEIQKCYYMLLRILV